MRKNKKHISTSVKRYTAKLFDDKCYFCNLDLSNSEKGQKHHHHFKKESDGASTCEEVLVLACSDCHRKIHKKVKLNAVQLRNILIKILDYCLDYKSKKKFSSKNNNLLEKWNLNLEYLYFRKSIYINLCHGLGIIPTTGDLYNYDDDLTFDNSWEEGRMIKSVLSRLDKNVGLMNIKRCENKPKLKKSKKEKEVIINIVLEWFDSIFIENERRIFDDFYMHTMEKIKNDDFDLEDVSNLEQLIKTNNSELAKNMRIFSKLFIEKN